MCGRAKNREQNAGPAQGILSLVINTHTVGLQEPLRTMVGAFPDPGEELNRVGWE